MGDCDAVSSLHLIGFSQSGFPARKLPCLPASDDERERSDHVESSDGLPKDADMRLACNEPNLSRLNLE